MLPGYEARAERLPLRACAVFVHLRRQLKTNRQEKTGACSLEPAPALSARKSYLKSNPAEIEMKVVFESSVIVSSLSKIMCHLASISDVKPLNGI